MRFSLIFFCMLLGFSSAAQAKRIALIIGNDAYSNLPARYQLQKAKNDARSTSETFKSLGFQVIEGFDLKRREMNVKLSAFANSIEPGDEVMFFFAGHGVRIEGLNYLLPSDIPAIDGASEDLLKSEAVRVDEISDRFRKKGARLSILVLDACRNNPYETNNGRSLGGTRGLAAMDPPEGTLVLFSAGAGQQALDRLSDDDANPNSVFTRTFLPLVRKKGLELSRLSRQVKAKVRDLARSVNHKQTPAVYNEVIGDVFLSGEEKGLVVEGPVKGSVKSAETRSFKPGESFKDCADCPEMIVVPKGSFMMGSPKGEKKREETEGPRHKVTISKRFAVGKFEVTRDQFEKFVKETSYETINDCENYDDFKPTKRSDLSYQHPGFIQNGNHPVVCINWNDAKTYIDWLSRKTGNSYRLLSEVEWEYVAKAGTDTPFWWGKSVSTSQANYNGDYTYNGPKGKSPKRTVSVDSFSSNGFGLFNVHGNVWEWVEDCWRENYLVASKDNDCKEHIIRGGSWVDLPEYIRSSYRIGGLISKRYFDTGIRVARELPQ